MSLYTTSSLNVPLSQFLVSSAFRMLIFWIMILETIYPCFAGRTSKWTACGCSWNGWGSWDDCSRTCNGQKYRNRSVKFLRGLAWCEHKFETCASPDMAHDYSRCNEYCYNGGTSDGYSCDCVTGSYGSCCEDQVTCSSPGDISNGRLHGTRSRYTYDDTVSYSCNSYYTLVGGTTTMRCSINGYWTGSKPRCAYFNSCSSNPCKNGGICTNIPDDYTCTCAKGWSGKTCHIDTLEPIVKNCPGNIYKRSELYEQEIQWQEPEFLDPHGRFEVVVSRNYPDSSSIFLWGDYIVKYSAVKPSNGLKNKCVFTIKVRPKPCPALDIPVNGAVVCNNWKTDYGQICLLFCEEFYSVARGINPNDWFVCGATGYWLPSNSMPNCTVWSLPPMEGYKIASMYVPGLSYEREIKTQYILKLRQSHLKKFCEKFESECKQEKVSIRMQRKILKTL